MMDAKCPLVETRWWKLWIVYPLRYTVWTRVKRMFWAPFCARFGHDFTHCDSGLLLDPRGREYWKADQWCVRCGKLCKIPFAESNYANSGWDDDDLMGV